MGDASKTVLVMKAPFIPPLGTYVLYQGKRHAWSATELGNGDVEMTVWPVAHTFENRLNPEEPLEALNDYVVGYDVTSRSDSEEMPRSSSGAMREKLNVDPYDLIPFQEIANAFSRVAEFGVKKYEPWNWSKGLSRVQLIGSLLRHTFSYLRGEERDKDSGLLHTDHIVWNAAVLCHNVEWGLEDGRRVEPERAYKAEVNGIPQESR